MFTVLLLGAVLLLKAYVLWAVGYVAEAGALVAVWALIYSTVYGRVVAA